MDLRLRVRTSARFSLISILGELQQLQECERVHNPAWTGWAVSLALGTLFALLSVVVHLL